MKYLFKILADQLTKLAVDALRSKQRDANKPTRRSRATPQSVSLQHFRTAGRTYEECITSAQQFARAGEYKSAIRLCDAAIRINPSSATAFNLRGQFKSATGDHTGAVKDYTSAIRLEPGVATYYENRGVCYWQLDRRHLAIADWQYAGILGSETARERLANVGVYRKDWKRFREIMLQRRIATLYHFTDEANLPSIRRHGGLYSWHLCRVLGIDVPKPGSNELSRQLDVSKELQDYVHLSFNQRPPMLYVAQRDGRISKPVVLRISTDVVFFEDTLFSTENAVATGAEIGGDLQDFLKINFWLARTGAWSNAFEKRRVQAEVLVRSHVPIRFILNI